jgi:hypothetical protein
MQFTIQPGGTADFTTLDDPQFLSARARLRERLAELPEHHPDHAELQQLYDAMTSEFDRRARRSWTQADYPRKER